MDKELIAFVGGLEEDASSPSKSPPLPVTKTGSSKSEKVNLAALTLVLNEELGFVHLKRKLSTLSSILPSEKAHASLATGEYTNGKSIEIVAAPLPSHEQKRLERKAAYELASKEASKWVPVIRANRQAKSLVYPVERPPHLHQLENSLSGSLAAPHNELDKALLEYWKEIGVTLEGGITAFDQMEPVTVNPEDLENYYAELAKKRSRLFFNEQKQRHQAKIKSKAYRRIVKRERERKERQELEENSGQLTAEEFAEQRIKAEMERIRERMTLKTRKANQWAHQLLQKRRLESSSREAVLQQVRDKQRLREEIMGKALQYQEASSSSEHEEVDDEKVTNYLRDDNDYGSGQDDDNASYINHNLTSSQPRLAGKKRGPTRPRDDFEDEENFQDDGECNDEIGKIFANVPSKSHNKVSSTTNTTVGRRRFDPPNPLNVVNDKVLPVTSRTQPRSKKNNDPTKSEQNDNERIDETAGNLASLFAPDQDIFTISTPQNDQGGEDEMNKGNLILDDKAKRQLEIIKKAFAADQVFKEFEERKAGEVAAEGPQEIDVTLPGWGSWGGLGIAPAKGKVILKKKGIIDPRNRQDAHLPHVIINERRSKKTLKLMVDRPPFPFTNREEFERKLDDPVGREWNSATGFKRKTTPRVQVKVGSIIEPIKFSKKSATDIV